MKIVNLRELYPHYESDTFVEVTDEIAELLRRYKLKEAADYLRTYRHRAFYSLDLDDGTEFSALSLLYQPTAFEIIERKQIAKLLYQGLATLPEKQRKRVYAHFFMGMNLSSIARVERCSIMSVKESIERGLNNLKKFFEKISYFPP